MVQKKQEIPWASEELWTQVVLSMSKTISALGSEATNLKSMAKQIVLAYAEIDSTLEWACLTSCPTCADVCCGRATVWYDLKDLLTIFLSTEMLPNNQIYRRPDTSCCNLTPSGCRLQRYERPFICTWYICPDQKVVIEGLPDCTDKTSLFRALDEIKQPAMSWSGNMSKPPAADPSPSFDVTEKIQQI